MAMSYRRSNCLDCGASGNDVPISKRGLCPDCGDRRWLETQRQMRAKSGPVAEKWRRGMLAAGGFNGRPITPHPPDA